MCLKNCQPLLPTGFAAITMVSYCTGIGVENDTHCAKQTLRTEAPHAYLFTLSDSMRWEYTIHITLARSTKLHMRQ